MITTAGLRWIVTALFMLTGAFWAYRSVKHGTFPDRAGDVLHVVMCVAMVAMAWPATMSIARLPQTVFFGLAAVWFLVVSLVGEAHDYRGGRGTALHHVVVMAAMAWMVFVMPRAMGGMSTHVGMTGMPGMPMPGDGAVPADVTVVALVLMVLFVVAGLVFLARAIDGARTSGPVLRTLSSGADGLMALGMGLMLVAMA
ncbi:DUF5134 domain-containing protein [Saccharopolyspora sp. 5N708]|uniref:DUF5134 domain-containing protein n=1 Tax=Saccharopolyspora sp. 5N708 TaxID=3457424 RepID=UPI003FD31879